MANIKFSAFTQKVALGDVDFLVGYTGADNVRVAPSVFSGIYLPLAGGTMTGDIAFNDNVKARFGTGLDSYIQHTGTNTEIINATGNLNIKSTATDGYITFYADNGSGGTTEYLRVDGAFTKTIFSRDFWAFDNTKALFGTSADLEIYHDGSHSYIVDTGTGSLILRGTDFQLNNSANTKNMITATDGGSVNLYYDAVQKFRTVSGGVEVTGTVYITGDGSNAATLTESGSGDFTISSIDDLRLESGGNDIVLRGASSAEFGRLSNDSQNLVIRNTNADKDIVFKGDDAGSAITALTLDMSDAGDAQFNRNVQLPDDGQLQLGGGIDLKILHNATNSYIQNYTGDLQIENHADDEDILFRSDDGSGGLATYFYLDGSLVNGTSVKGATRFPDSSKIYLGTDGDLEMFHDGSNTYLENYTGDFIFTQAANDKDIQFKSDDGAGGTTLYYYLDGSIVRNRFPKNVYLEDDVRLQFGDPSTPDLEIYHDGTESFIENSTGDLWIKNTGDDLIVQGADDVDIKVQGGEMAAKFGGNGGVDLYHNNVVKFSTTSTGTTTTGQMNIAALNTAPASAGAAGTLGEIRYTADYIYVCTATNTWKRAALSTW